MSKNWTCSWLLCFLKKLPLRGSWVYLPLDHRSKTTSHPKWQENWVQYIKLCTIRCPWFIDEFLYNSRTYFFIFITGFSIWCQQIHRESSIRKKWRYEWGATGKPDARTNKKQKMKLKWRTRRSTKRPITWIAGFAAGVEREFGRWT